MYSQFLKKKDSALKFFDSLNRKYHNNRIY